ncbi:MAG: YeeE/YedE family protein [Burkholderiaceae bacterium]|nr:YeeE/YedE family protein [Burkholderiaceae bacterium]
MIKKIGFALAAGVLFATGLVVSGMTQPAKVLGFLNFGGIFAPARFGAWDASLAFVMGGAVMVTLVAFAMTPRLGRKPWAAATFELPTRQDIDFKLMAGAALFGIGWGLSGYCPGPALASLLSGGVDVLVFVAAMLVGLLAAKRLGV